MPTDDPTMTSGPDGSQSTTYGAPASVTPSPSGKGFLCACANFLPCGIGQCIAGYPRRGACWFAAWLLITLSNLIVIAFPRLNFALMFLFPIAFVFSLAALIDGFICGRRSQRRLLATPLLRYLIGILFIVAAIAVSSTGAQLLRATLFETFATKSQTMLPTLEPGDRFAISKRDLPLRRWDVVVFDSPTQAGSLWVMRIAGLPGETVEVKNGQLYANGASVGTPDRVGPYTNTLDESGNGCEGHPLSLGPDEYFILGDNSPHANDSRYWNVSVTGHKQGALPRSSIKGRVIFVYWPISQWKTVP